MTVNRCSGEPISWLRLERHHLGEGDAPERARIAAHLESCAACATCLAEIAKDDGVALPPLAARPVAPIPAPGAGKVLRLGLGRVALIAGGLAVAAGALFGIGNGWRSGPGPSSPHVGVGGGATRSATKGDAIAFTLVRDDDERIAEAGGIYRDGDRFKAIVTCPPEAQVAFDLVVFDSDGASFPLPPAPDVRCGNDVPLPGAFRMTGRGVETVCLTWTEGRSRDLSASRALLAKGPAALGEKSLCKTLTAPP